MFLLHNILLGNFIVREPCRICFKNVYFIPSKIYFHHLKSVKLHRNLSIERFLLMKIVFYHETTLDKVMTLSTFSYTTTLYVSVYT